MNMSLKGKTALITGGNQGLGFEIAKKFVQAGANVMLCARDGDLLAQAEKALAKLAKENRILSCVTDISQVHQVKALVANTQEVFQHIDILVSNAGVYGPKGGIEQINWDEWSQAIDINLKGTVLLCHFVIEAMKARHYGKIILLSGGGATKPLPYLSAYAASKAAVVRFGETLAEEVKDFNIDVNAIAPGALNTRLLDEVLAAGPEKVGKDFYAQSLKQKASGGTSFDKAVDLCTFLASSASDGITGRLLSAIWDPWKTLADYADDLRQSDVYTLRRIVPEDRGKTWEKPI